MKKKKVYVLMVSRVFPAYHPRAGEDTFFKVKIKAENQPEFPVCFNHMNDSMLKDVYQPPSTGLLDLMYSPKIHTIRENYDLWAKRAEKINAGEAVLSLRQWSGKPYNSKQVEFLRLQKIGVQRVGIEITKARPVPLAKEMLRLLKVTIDGKRHGSIPLAPNIEVPQFDLEYLKKIAHNDGLNDYDFKHWFKKNMDGVIIHFSNFRY